MIHTIEVIRHFNRIREFKELHSLRKGFKKYDDITEYELYLKMPDVGINKITLTKVNYYNVFSIKVEVNLSKLIGGEKLSLYRAGEKTESIRANFQYHMYQLIENNTNSEVFDDLELFTDFDLYNVTRIDCTVQRKVSDVKTYIELLQRGDIPHKNGAEFELHEDFKNKKDVAEPKEGSIYYKSKRLNVNFYDKSDELSKHGGTEEDIKKAKGILRLEVQCLYKTLDYQRKAITNKKNKTAWDGEKLIDYRSSNTKKFKFFNNKEFSEKMVTDKFIEVAQKGKYYKRSVGLAEIENSSKIHKQTKDKLTEIYNFVNPLGHKRRSIRELREKINSKTYKGTIQSSSELDRYLKRFDKIGVNAVALKEDYRFKDKEKFLPSLYEIIINEEYFVF